MTKEVKFATKVTLVCTVITVLSIPTMQGWGLAFTLQFFSFPLAYLEILPHISDKFLYDYNLFILIPICNVFFISYFVAKIFYFFRKKR